MGLFFHGKLSPRESMIEATSDIAIGLAVLTVLALLASSSSIIPSSDKGVINKNHMKYLSYVLAVLCVICLLAVSMTIILWDEDADVTESYKDGEAEKFTASVIPPMFPVHDGRVENRNRSATVSPSFDQSMEDLAGVVSPSF